MNSNKRQEVLAIFAEHGMDLGTSRVQSKHLDDYGGVRGGDCRVSHETIRQVRNAICKLQGLRMPGMDAAAVHNVYMQQWTKQDCFLPTPEFIKLALACKTAERDLALACKTAERDLTLDQGDEAAIQGKCLRAIDKLQQLVHRCLQATNGNLECLEILKEEKDKLVEQWAILNNWQDQLEDYHNQLKAEREQLGQPAQLVEDYQPTNWKEF